MSHAVKLFIALLGLATACCTPERAEDANSPFFRCWGFQRVESGGFLIRFSALVYPRNGVIALNENCPTLRLSMRFVDTAMPQGFDVGYRLGRNPSRRYGISGQAIVSIEGVEPNNVMTVRVIRVVTGEYLSDQNTSRLDSIGR